MDHTEPTEDLCTQEEARKTNQAIADVPKGSEPPHGKIPDTVSRDVTAGTSRMLNNTGSQVQSTADRFGIKDRQDLLNLACLHFNVSLRVAVW